MFFPLLVIHKTGKFHKTAAINEAAASVKDNSSIVFQLDLHLDLPLNLMETVRKVDIILEFKKCKKYYVRRDRYDGI